MPAGRPSLYKPEYCEEIINSAKQGFSLTGFAGQIGVSRRTITEWAEQHPEFSLAVTQAKAAAAASWERRAINIGDGNGGPGAAGMVQFALKNLGADDWQDKITNEHTGKDGGAIQITDETRVRALAAFLAKTGAK